MSSAHSKHSVITNKIAASRKVLSECEISDLEQCFWLSKHRKFRVKYIYFKVEPTFTSELP